MKEKIRAANEKAKNLQPWEGYYMVRGLETENLFRFSNPGHMGTVLDMGCGNGFTSYLISSKADKVVASDLYKKDAVTHTVGLENARSMFSRMGKSNIAVLASSADMLPFKNDSFDVIYAGYLLQYIKNRDIALKELRRTVKRDGIVILLLPNFLERAWAFLQFYIYLAVKAVKNVSGLFAGRPGNASAGEKGTLERIGKFRQDYKYFPFPGPHGAYRNSAVEMIRHMPASWNREFRESGFKIARSFTTTFVPYPLALTFSLKTAQVLSGIFGPFTRYFGNKPVMKYLGYNYCVVLRK